MLIDSVKLNSVPCKEKKKKKCGGGSFRKGKGQFHPLIRDS